MTVLSSEAGLNPVWEIEMSGRRLAVFQPGVGAPLAAPFLEEVIAMGCRRLVVCGGAGALLPELVLGHAVVVASAIRDEGTSYHYLPPSRVVDADPHAVATLVDTLDAAGVAHLVAVHSGPRLSVEGIGGPGPAHRVAEGAVLVEMEEAALLAVAQYRKVMLGQVLLAGDSLAGACWDDRGWTSAHAAREKLFWLAADAALAL